MSLWYKWAQMDTPSKFLEGLYACGDLRVRCSPLHDLMEVQQAPEWHPEGTAGIHTMLVCDSMAKICTRDRVGADDRYLYLLSALAHDFGKAISTRWHETKNKWVSYGHDMAGVPIAEGWLDMLTPSLSFVDKEFVLTMVRWHMVHTQSTEQCTSKAARKLLLNLQGTYGSCSWASLVKLMEADTNGRGDPVWQSHSSSVKLMNERIKAMSPQEAVDV